MRWSSQISNTTYCSPRKPSHNILLFRFFYARRLLKSIRTSAILTVIVANDRCHCYLADLDSDLKDEIKDSRAMMFRRKSLKSCCQILLVRLAVQQIVQKQKHREAGNGVYRIFPQCSRQMVTPHASLVECYSTVANFRSACGCSQARILPVVVR